MALNATQLRSVRRNKLGKNIPKRNGKSMSCGEFFIDFHVLLA